MTDDVSLEERERETVGLCARCVHAHVIENRRGSRFYRCRLADVDPSFSRYPPLPVRQCRGFQPANADSGPQTR
jgi:hypothetical protein